MLHVHPGSHRALALGQGRRGAADGARFDERHQCRRGQHLDTGISETVCGQIVADRVLRRQGTAPL